MKKKNKIFVSLLISLSASAFADVISTGGGVQEGPSAFAQNMAQQANTQTNHLANIDTDLAFSGFQEQQVYQDSGMGALNAAFPLITPIPQNPVTVPQNALTQQDFWQLFCGFNQGVGSTTSNKGGPVASPITSSFIDPTTNQLDLTCVDSFSSANANNVIPLVMASSSNVVNAVNPKETGNGNSSNAQTSGSNQVSASVQGANINTMIAALQTSTSNQNAVQSYISALTTAPTIASNLNNGSSVAPEMTLISSVLQAVANDYQAPDASQNSTNAQNAQMAAKIPSIEASVNQVFSPSYLADLGKANTPELLRMLILETAKSNQIKALQVEQQERDNVLLAAILADLVKSNQSTAALYQQGVTQQQIEQANQSLLMQINYSLQSQKSNSKGGSQ